MTVDDAKRIFTRGTLRFNETEVFFYGDGQYQFSGSQESVNGTYEFVQLSGKVYLRTIPPILLGIKDLEITICLEGLPVSITTEP